MPSSVPPFESLDAILSGACHTEELWRTLYATDASVYREYPVAVVIPKTIEDIRQTIAFAHMHQLPIIPRAAGTSLAGQVVGQGIIVDISQHFNQILEFNAEEQWVRVQPGVIRNELNAFLAPHGFFFGPNTSTANRCMMGGMVGNNSCGSTSIVYGSTRDHVLSLSCLLSDGSEVTFEALSPEAFHEKRQQGDLEGQIYNRLYKLLGRPETQERIRVNFPKASIHRRNTGYAVDELIKSAVFSDGGGDINLCQLLTGSEGTLAFTTEIKLHIDPLPAPEVIVVAAHFADMQECMEAVLTAMAAQPTACELMDDTILRLTKQNITQQKNRFFVEGDPRAILLVEFRAETAAEVLRQAEQLIAAFQRQQQGYSYPLIQGDDTQKAWTLRAAGLGILGNLPGDKKAVACIEDTAVAIEDLPAYIAEFTAMMEKHGQEPVYYAHAGAGELHLRPILDLKQSADRQAFHDITLDVAQLVKKYGGSLSGEHGDGRLRAPFIPLMIGEDNYELLRQIKAIWDPKHLFNPGKIVDAPPMNETLRYAADQETPSYDTLFDFSQEGGILRLAEKCNGSGDCRKLAFSGGVMCPSYRATREEKDSTRGRANALREVLTQNAQDDPFQHPLLEEALDLCLSCKGCTAECPSNVDMAMLKAEYLYQKYRKRGFPLRSRAFAAIDRLNAIGSHFPGLANFFLQARFFSGWLKKGLSVAPQRSLPALSPQSFSRWWRKVGQSLPVHQPVRKTVYLFCDEFTQYNDAEIGELAVRLLKGLGYDVLFVEHPSSGRAHISKGLLDEAQKLARQNVQLFAPLISAERPLVGIEPSAILGFQDEYPRLLRGEDQESAQQLAPHAMMIDTFLAREAAAGRISATAFTTKKRSVLLHGHCHQKALADPADSAFILSLPEHYTVEMIPSGCCGMAGSFGYEQEHYELSMRVGEEILFPRIRQSTSDTIIAAPGTSCRHQIVDGTTRQALHPISVLWEAFRNA